MRNLLLAVFVLAGCNVTIGQNIQTEKVEFGYADSWDDTVWVKRGSDGEMYFADNTAGSSISLEVLMTAPGEGITTSAADIRYVNVTGDTMTGNLTLSGYVDPAGNTTLGGHVVDETIHYFRPKNVLIVSKSGTGRGGEFTSINDAVDSITDSASDNQYLVLVAPGTYTDIVTIGSSYISIEGMGSRGGVLIDTTSYEAINFSCPYPGYLKNLTIYAGNSSSHCAVITTHTGTLSMYDCDIVGDRSGGTDAAIKSTGGGALKLVDCDFYEVGSTGVESYSIYDTVGGSTNYLYNCRYLSTKNDHVFLYVPSTATGTSKYYIYDFSVSDSLVQTEGTHGLFRLQHNTSVYLYDAWLRSYGVIIHPSSTAGTINFCRMQTNYWGWPASGLTTAPITMSGGIYKTNVTLIAPATLDMGYGDVAINTDKDAWLRYITADTVTATTGTFMNVNIDFDNQDQETYTTGMLFLDLGTTATGGIDMTNSGLAGTTDKWIAMDSNNYWRADGSLMATTGTFRTASVIDASANEVATINEDGDVGLSGAIRFTTTTEAQETAGFSAIKTTSDSLRIDLDVSNEHATSHLKLFQNNALNPSFDVVPASAGDGGDIYAYNGATQVGRLAFASTGLGCYFLTGGAMWGFTTADFKIRPPAAGKFRVQKSVSPFTAWFEVNEAGTGSFLKFADAAGVYLFSFKDFADAIVLSVNSDGDVAMASDATLTIPDGASTGPFYYQASAVSSINESASTNETVGSTGVGDSAAADLFFEWIVPTRIVGGTVVVDRCTVIYSGADADDYIDAIYLYSANSSGAWSAKISHTDNIVSGQSHQWIDADYTMLTGEIYYMRIVTAENGGALLIRGFTFEYHLE